MNLENLNPASATEEEHKLLAVYREFVTQTFANRKTNKSKPYLMHLNDILGSTMFMSEMRNNQFDVSKVEVEYLIKKLLYKQTIRTISDERGNTLGYVLLT